VGVTLTPFFTWNFGDGTIYSTTSPGAPYPNGTISHTYTSAGTYKVSLTISWAGTWSAENNTYAVLGGNIVQSYSSTFVVSNAPTKFVK
jgi:PKD repeat protein